MRRDAFLSGLLRLIPRLCKYVRRHFSKHVFMSPTVNAPFIKFYNLCYLMNQSTGCRVGSVMAQDKGLMGSPRGQRGARVFRQHCCLPGSRSAQNRCWFFCHELESLGPLLPSTSQAWEVLATPSPHQTIPCRTRPPHSPGRRLPSQHQGKLPDPAPSGVTFVRPEANPGRWRGGHCVLRVQAWWPPSPPAQELRGTGDSGVG